MRKGKGQFYSKNKKTSYRYWLADRPEHKILMLHGFGAYSAYFETLAKYLTSKKISLFACDLFGFGESAGKKGDIKNFHIYLQQIRTFIEILKQSSENKRYYIAGESMGGLLALWYTLISNDPDQNGIIAIAPAIALKNPPLFTLPLIRLMANIIPSFKITVTNNDSTRDKTKIKMMQQDLLRVNSMTIRFLVQFLKTMQYVSKNPDKINIPILMLQGKKDNTIDQNKIKKFFNLIKKDEKNKMIFYPKGYHDLLGDIDQEKIFIDIIDWIKTI